MDEVTVRKVCRLLATAKADAARRAAEGLIVQVPDAQWRGAMKQIKAPDRLVALGVLRDRGLIVTTVGRRTGGIQTAGVEVEMFDGLTLAGQRLALDGAA